MTGDSVLECQGLRKTYGERVAVDGVGFRIAAGETYGLLGPNGAGKTTTISMVCGLLRRDAGDVEVVGRPLDDDVLAAKAVIGYVPQEIALYPDLTGEENLRFFGRLQGLRGTGLADRVARLLDVVGLADRRTERVEAYSGGMKRRLNIAVGMLNEPRLLVLDEPTVGVDPQSRHAILEAVDDLGGQGLAVLYTTHYMEEAERLCDRVGILDEGRLVAEGTRAELVASVAERDRIRCSWTGPAGDLIADLRATEGVLEVTPSDSGLDMIVASSRAVLPRLLAHAETRGVVLTSVQVVEPDLESVFLQLTGKALRD